MFAATPEASPRCIRSPFKAGVFGTVNGGQLFRPARVAVLSRDRCVESQCYRKSDGVDIRQREKRRSSRRGVPAADAFSTSKITPWQPINFYAVGQEILDNHFQIEFVSYGWYLRCGAAPNLEHHNGRFHTGWRRPAG